MDRQTSFYSKSDSFQVLLKEFPEKNRKIRGVLLLEFWINDILDVYFTRQTIFGPKQKIHEKFTEPQECSLGSQSLRYLNHEKRNPPKYQ